MFKQTFFEPTNKQVLIFVSHLFWQKNKMINDLKNEKPVDRKGFGIEML